MQVGTEFRIRNNGDTIVDNPELELARISPRLMPFCLIVSMQKRASTSCVCSIL